MPVSTFKSIATEKENLERILDNLSEGIIAHDKERRILFFNRAAEDITGYQRKDILGRDCHEAFGRPFCGDRCSFKDGPPDSLEHATYPLNIFTPEGKLRRIEMRVTGMLDHDGAFVGVLASFRDLTELIGLRLQLVELTHFGIVGQDPKIMQIFREIRDLATSDYPVCITGETGTGKELVANAIHDESLRAGKPFVPVNCGALPEGLLESELFGHVKGAFTGAVRDKKGRFEMTDGGTLFLDEVAELPKTVQVKLLRVLQEGTFERVGGEERISVDVRIITATNKNLKREVEKGNFRDDLYYRINVVPIHMPPLRERRSDIPVLVAHFLRRAAEQGQESPGFSKEAMTAMEDYAWPGNVRELQSAVRFALVKARGRMIRPEYLPLELKEWLERRRGLYGPKRKLDPDNVRTALTHTGGNKAKAARLLGVGRATLYRFLADMPDL
ncbi:MAG: sigma-54 dependent transcriptional regulator, acetoin dehydrogenase operon transcriptional [Thermodesulfobacteriota bacterium]|nr:sigma-54 dependent transcriptional regulator, acetoin dehydrogenase operon transcriptional [Thermodesulfobacteriota bacterium]